MWQFCIWLIQAGPEFCVRGIPSSPFAPLYGALVCGIEVPGGYEKALFQDTGLIHILVVSGAHLIFVERLCFGISKGQRLVITGIYCWLTGLGAPVARAFTRRLLECRLRNWGWTGLQTEAASSLLLLSLHPSWAFSRSFLMSWLCALAVLTPLRLSSWPQLSTSLKCYAFLLPFTLASPLTVAWNCLLGPMIGYALFPACLIAFACPWLVPACDWIWTCVLWLMELGPRTPSADHWIPTVWIWWLPPTAHAALIYGEWKWRREAAFS